MLEAFVSRFGSWVLSVAREVTHKEGWRGREGGKEGRIKGWEKGWVRVREEGSSKASPRDAVISQRPKRWVCCFIIGFFFG